MGFADMLILLEIKYDEPKALEFAGKVMKFIQEEARNASIALGLERGSFPNFEKSIYKDKYVMIFFLHHLRYLIDRVCKPSTGFIINQGYGRIITGRQLIIDHLWSYRLTPVNLKLFNCATAGPCDGSEFIAEGTAHCT